VSVAAEQTAEQRALALLRDHGHPAAKVVRVGTPGDAGTRFTELLYVDPQNKARRGYIYQPPGAKRGGTEPKDPIVWTYPGWGLPTGYEEAPDADA
jgi:hypothetical protein